MKRFGYVRPRPSDFVLRIDKGQIVSQERGLSFFCFPWNQYCIIPSEVSTISFSADQITKENQGIQVDGFAIWKITHPEKTYLHFDFDVRERAFETINTYLREAVMSAIRHQVASMTIDDVLRKRGTIILQLKEELAYIAGQWGLEIETIEIKNVLIMSEQLFSNMQAPHRNAVRLESEISELGVEQEIAEKRLEQQDKIALREQEFKRRELERTSDMEARRLQEKTKIDQLKLGEDKAVKLLKIEQELAIFEQEQEARRQQSSLQLATLKAEQPLRAMRGSIQSEQKHHEIQLGQSDLQLVAEKIAASNSEDPTHILYNKLPEIAAALNISEINLSHDNLDRLLSGMIKLIKKGPTEDQ